MKSFALLLSFLVFYTASSLAQAPVLQWQKCYGGTAEDFTRSLELTSDGGFIFCASTESSDGQVAGNHGEADFWLVKADATGNIEWQKCLGGSEDDYGWAMKQTRDGGYIMTGFAISDDGDITTNLGNYDYWVIKTDVSGNIQWQKNYGGSRYDAPYSIEQTSDHGYVISGSEKSNDKDVTGYHGAKDGWILKLDSIGNIQWQKALGGTAIDDAFDAHETSDGGYIVAGNTQSNNGDVSGNHGKDDVWVIKLSHSGSIQWSHCYGGSDSDVARFVQQTPDGGYAVIGWTLSNDGDVSGNHGMFDIWVIKINSTGALEWQKCFGGSGIEYGRWLKPTPDGGLLINGPSGSTDGDVTGNHGDLDFWLAKLDASHNIEWQKSVGGSAEEYDYAFQADGEGNYFLGGLTESFDGDVVGNHGDEDVWIVKLTTCNLALSGSTINETCPGTNGSINLTVSGGNAPLTYHWSNGATTEDISGLGAGAYSVSVTDNLGCTATSGFQITPLSFGTPTGLKTTNIASTSATLKWKITGVPSGFKIQYKLTSSSTWTTKTISNGTKTSYKIAGLAPSSQYEWQIRENCGSQSSPYSASKLFTTLAAKEGESIVADQIDLNVYPNPSTGIFTVDVNGISNDEVMIDVTDVSGRILLEEHVASADGSMLHQIDLQGFNGGYYLIHVTDGADVYALPLMIAK